MSDITTTAADVLTDDAAIFLIDRQVVPLSPTLSQALHATDPPRALQLVTPTTSRLTLPLHALITAGRADWVVREESGYYTGLTGQPLQWTGKAFTPIPDAPNYAKGFAQHPSEPLGTHLTLTLQAKHPTSTLLGALTEHLMQALTGGPPTGWGTTEPTEHPWNRTDLTRTARNSQALQTITTGNAHRPATAVTSYTRTQAETTESTTLTIGYHPGERPPLERLPEMVSAIAADQNLASILLQTRLGRPDLTIEPRWSGTSSPVALAMKGSYTAPPEFPSTRSGPMTWFTLGTQNTKATWQTYRHLTQTLTPATPPRTPNSTDNR
ncbi:DUF6177 family protein [Actinomadura hibisca]|uniref:DUF6177 family protein n=1 Tax=Actinomadura hibisca TaxID=68565 RepID=UPI000A9F1A25|nr:DUF6177 family protein [Actinomadura hibisca]